MEEDTSRTPRVQPQAVAWAGRLFWLIVMSVWATFLSVVIIDLLAPFLVEKRWLHSALLVATAALIMINVARELPVQNVIAAGFIIGLIGAFAHGINALTGFPFGPCVYTQDIGRPLFNFLPWPMFFIWPILVLTSRGVARLVLGPWRQSRNYGIWLLGITGALVAVLALGLEVFCTVSMHYWEWQLKQLPVSWYGGPPVNFLGWMVVGLVTTLLATPFLISKHPHPATRADSMPLIVWSGLSGLFAVAAVMSGAFFAAGVQTASGLVAIVIILGLGACSRR